MAFLERLNSVFVSISWKTAAQPAASQEGILEIFQSINKLVSYFAGKRCQTIKKPLVSHTVFQTICA
jgi:hypothetical protein